MARRIRLWLPPLAYMAIIFSFSAQSNPLPAVTARVWDKLLHMTEYGGLAFLLARALMGDGRSWRAVVLGATLLASAYGATDEYHQSFVPGRDSSVLDWSADTLGSIVGAGAYAAARRRLQPARNDHQPATGH
jgi:VanZ family protein